MGLLFENTNLDESNNIVYDLLKIATNMMKCKYEILRNQDPVENKNIDTHIFISINSLLSTWFLLMKTRSQSKNIPNILKEKVLNDTITIEQLISQIFELIIHYKKFYNFCSNLKIYLYFNDLYEEKSSIPLNIFSQNYKYKDLINETMNILNKIIIYIPNIYFINTKKYHASILPYSVITDIRDTCKSSQRILLVSNDKIDYTCLGINNINNDLNIVAFRSRKFILLNFKNVCKECILSSIPIKNCHLEAFIKSYPIFLTIFSNKMVALKDVDFNVFSKNRREFIKLAKETDIINYDFMGNFLIDFYKDRTKLNIYKFTNIVDIYLNNCLEIKSEETYWRHDRIDFSIETLNDVLFKKYKIDFTSLF